MTPRVSVSITAYNHAAFIRQALDGVLAQVTDFPVEILVGEDNSTDGTREIVREYAGKYPGRITAFFHDDASKLRINGRLTGRANLAHNLKSARGEYIALLDGDDYWIDETKLARQVAHLDSDRTLSTSFHDAVVVDENGRPVDSAKTIHQIKSRYRLEEMIAGEFQAQTCTVMFRRESVLPLPRWFYETAVGDFVLHVLNGQAGDFGFIDRPMGCYRVHGGGVWTQGRGASGWVDKSEEQSRRTMNRFEMMADLLGHVAGNAAERYRPLARKRRAFFAYAAAKYAAGLGEKSTLRRSMKTLLRSHPWPDDVRWSILWKLARKCV